ncbi:MAG: flagellar hook capping FlgD N-terminal domain-containing protein [candidate division Zixibacteria bacterium]|nr:flagellar hook capping FlgD N-terminal domain-containing protein [candidate division Zixibacteria bacterium]
MEGVIPTNNVFPEAMGSAPSGNISALGKDQFLQLLVTQLQNQDPLSPMEDKDFIAQLAQFSSVEQLSNISDGISESNQNGYLQMQSINNVMASNLIGKEVKAGYDSVYYDGSTSPKISFTSDQYAEDLQINIKDINGSTVAVLNESGVSAGKHTYEWDGFDSNGNRANVGQYNIEVVATSSSGETFNPDMVLIGKVESVIYRGGAAYFRVDGVEIPFGDVAAIGEEGSFDNGG